MHVIVVASQKGGAGKTTTARNIAVAAVEEVGSVALVDLDPQGSLAEWWERRSAEQPVMTTLDVAQLQAGLDVLRKAKVALVVIDTPPSAHPFLIDVLRTADLVLLPVRPTPDDLGAIGATLDLVETAARPFAFVITQAKARTKLTAEALRVLAQHGRVAPTMIHDRVEFPTAAITGSGVTEAAPSSKAADEIRELVMYVLKQLRKGART